MWLVGHPPVIAWVEILWAYRAWVKLQLTSAGHCADEWMATGAPPA